jgi:hypothetical protein
VDRADPDFPLGAGGQPLSQRLRVLALVQQKYGVPVQDREGRRTAQACELRADRLAQVGRIPPQGQNAQRSLAEHAGRPPYGDLSGEQAAQGVRAPAVVEQGRDRGGVMDGSGLLLRAQRARALDDPEVADAPVLVEQRHAEPGRHAQLRILRDPDRPAGLRHPVGLLPGLDLGRNRP